MHKRTFLSSVLPPCSDANLHSSAIFGQAIQVTLRALRPDRMKMSTTATRVTPFGKLGAAREIRGVIGARISHYPLGTFDEPTAGLDVLVARAVMQSIDQLRALGKRILFSTHTMRQVEKLCDRAAILSRARIRASGTWLELRARYGH
jgi:sodium transport system ATP-binding protein